MRVQCILSIAFFLIYMAHGMDIPSKVRALFYKVKHAQVTKSSQGVPPFSWTKDKGLFESNVKLYFHGSFNEFILREVFKIFDNNNFATSWITIALLEVHEFDRNKTIIDKEMILNAVKAIGNFDDKNKFNASIQTFWPQEYNASVATWQSAPHNLLKFFSLLDYIPWALILKFLKKIGIADADMIKNIQQLLQERYSN